MSENQEVVKSQEEKKPFRDKKKKHRPEKPLKATLGEIIASKGSDLFVKKD